MDDLIKKYRHEKLKFESYYKYSFVYSNKKIRVETSGDNNYIYRAWLTPEMTLKNLIKEAGDEVDIRELGEKLKSEE